MQALIERLRKRAVLRRHEAADQGEQAIDAIRARAWWNARRCAEMAATFAHDALDLEQAADALERLIAAAEGQRQRWEGLRLAHPPSQTGMEPNEQINTNVRMVAVCAEETCERILKAVR